MCFATSGEEPTKSTPEETPAQNRDTGKEGLRKSKLDQRCCWAAAAAKDGPSCRLTESSLNEPIKYSRFGNIALTSCLPLMSAPANLRTFSPIGKVAAKLLPHLVRKSLHD
jgi:hypothetical protein